MSDTKQSALDSVNAAYQGRVDNLEGAAEKREKEREESEKGFEHTDTTPVEEARFVANPENLRKDATSEEEFAEGLEDGDDPSEKPKTAKKTAAKK